MSSFLRLLALDLFAATGVAVAVGLATSAHFAPEGDVAQAPVSSVPATNDLANSNPGTANPPRDYGAPQDYAGSSTMRMVPPHREFAQQVPQDPSLTSNAAGATTALPGAQMTPDKLGELGKALLDQLQAQQQNAAPQTPPSAADVPPSVPPQNFSGPPNPGNVPPAKPARAKEPPPPADEGEDEEEGMEEAPAPAAPRKGGPSTFKVTKLPQKGDDHLSVHIQNKDLRDVLDFLGEQGGLSILASNNVQGVVSVSLNDVSIDTALKAILRSTGFVSRQEGKFIYVGTPKDIVMMAQSVDRIGTRVYRPNYVKAAELQPLIMPLLSPAGNLTGAISGTSAVAVSPPAQMGIAADNSQTGGDTFAEGEVVVVRDYEAVLCEIDQLVAEIDKRPLQVQIEAMILSVEIKDTNSFGVDFQFLRDKQHVLLATGSPLADLGQVSVTDGGLKFGFLDSSLGAFVSALQTIGDTNVIATPRLMCVNKHKAEILIGQQLGYVTKTLTQTTTAQSVEFLEVGTQLRLRPFISTDGLIRMEVHPEVSTGNVDVTPEFTLPNKQTTQVTTNVMVRDGCTVVIGGLMQESLSNSGSQVPFLGSLPGVGFLFRDRKGTQNRNEIIVLITPHIAYEPESCIEGDKAAADFHRQHAVYKDQLTPLNSRYIGRKFFRLAQNAWAANDKKAAIRYVNLSIHFDPQNRASIDLRSDIMADNHFGDHTVTPLTPVGPASNAVNGERIDPWVLDNLERAEMVPDAMPHPRDPGVPGKMIQIERGSEFR